MTLQTVGRKALSMVLALALVLSMVPAFVVAADDGFSDTAGHWAEAAISTWAGYGVLSGYPDGTFLPNGNISRAELAKVLNGIIGYQTRGSKSFSDVAAGDWFADAVLKLADAGVMQGSDGLARPNDAITREEAAVLIARAFAVAGNSSTSNAFADAGDIANWAYDLVNGMKVAGYVQGSENRFSPKSNITRGEVVTILNNMISVYYNEAGTYGGSAVQNITGNVVVSSADVVLQNMNITGNLYLMNGLAKGAATLKNVTVSANTFVRGGGSNSVHLENCKINELVVDGDSVRVVLEGGTTVTYSNVVDGTVVLGSGVVVDSIVIAAGGTVVVQSGVTLKAAEIAGGTLNVEKGGVVTKATATASGSKLANEGTVTQLVVEAAIAVTGSSAVTEAVIKANGSTFVKAPTRYDIAAGYSSVFAGATVTGSSSSTGGGGVGIGDGGSSSVSWDIVSESVDHNKIEVKLGSNVDGATFTVKQGTTEVAVSNSTYNADTKTYTLGFATEAIKNGLEYTVTAAKTGTTFASAKKFTPDFTNKVAAFKSFSTLEANENSFNDPLYRFLVFNYDRKVEVTKNEFTVQLGTTTIWRSVSTAFGVNPDAYYQYGFRNAAAANIPNANVHAMADLAARAAFEQSNEYQLVAGDVITAQVELKVEAGNYKGTYILSKTYTVTADDVTYSKYVSSADRAAAATAIIGVLGNDVAAIKTAIVANGVQAGVPMAQYNALNDAGKTVVAEALKAAHTATALTTETLATAFFSAVNNALAAAFRSTHAAALALTVGTVAIGNKAIVTAALDAFDGLKDSVKALLTAEKTLLDALAAKIAELEAAAAFNTRFATILALTEANVTALDLTANAALIALYEGDAVAVPAVPGFAAAYAALSAGAKTIVVTEYGSTKYISIDALIAAVDAKLVELKKVAAIKAANDAITALPVDTAVAALSATAIAALKATIGVAADAGATPPVEATGIYKLIADAVALTATAGDGATNNIDTTKLTAVVAAVAAWEKAAAIKAANDAITALPAAADVATMNATAIAALKVTIGVAADAGATPPVEATGIYKLIADAVALTATAGDGATNNIDTTKLTAVVAAVAAWEKAAAIKAANDAIAALLAVYTDPDDVAAMNAEAIAVLKAIIGVPSDVGVEATGIYALLEAAAALEADVSDGGADVDTTDFNLLVDAVAAWVDNP